jgi:putative tricarboxylic transport membrane protein
MASTGRPEPRSSQVIKGPQNFVGGILIMAIAAFAMWLGSDLPAGTLGGMGPGMMPRSVAVLLCILGAALVVDSILERGDGLGTWSLRGIFFVLGAILVFAYTVRLLGLAIAAPLAIWISAFASDEARWIETILFSIAMTAFCIGLFKYALGLPIPLAPWLLDY